jgi:HD-GYP domain-containing protein (c-di-GMP phosphodiesterase class II)
MTDKVERYLKDLFSLLQIAKIYTIQHPKFKDFLDRVYEELRDILREKEELVIGIVGEELAFEREIFFGLSKSVKSVTISLRARGIERIIFYRNLEKEELVKFISYLALPQAEVPKDSQQYFFIMGIRNIEIGKIKTSSAEVRSKESVEYESYYGNSLNTVSQSVENVLNGESVDYLDLKFNMVNVMENLVDKYQEFLKLTIIRRYDVGTFIHLLNVSIISMFFSFKIGFNKEDCLDIGIAALFHDIGKLYISRKIIQKPDRLTEEELTTIRSHTILGADLLLKYTDALGILPMVVAFEHHLRYDLKGYPKLSFTQKPLIASLIVSICDVYDALNERRSYKNDYPPNVIREIMLKEKGGGFDPNLLDSFFKLMGVWPIGTIVSLSDARVAIVREENDDDIFSPKVEVVFPTEKKEFIDLKEKKGEVVITRSLNPLRDGKEYAQLV